MWKVILFFFFFEFWTSDSLMKIQEVCVGLGFLFRL